MCCFGTTNCLSEASEGESKASKGKKRELERVLLLMHKRVVLSILKKVGNVGVVAGMRLTKGQEMSVLFLLVVEAGAGAN